MIEKIFILHHTHVDLGFTAGREEVFGELVGMVDRAAELVAGSAGRGEAERFRWIHEVSWPVVEYLRRGGQGREVLFDQIRRGRVELTALYTNPTDLMDRDSFEVSIDYACRLAQQHDLPLTTAMFSDCPGIAWSIVDLLAQRGIRYLSAAPNFIMSYPLEVDRPFYWEGPAGGRLLTWLADWRTTFYAEGLKTFKLQEAPAEATKRLLDYAAQLEGEGYRWSGLAIHVAIDNQPPLPQLMDFVAYFNADQSARRATLATNRDFFEFMEARHGAEFPVHRGAWPDWWANGIASAAFETACSRRAKASLRRSEALSRLLGAPRDPDLLKGATEDMLMFDEHTWGHSVAVSDPWCVQSRLQWAQKRACALAALEKAQRLESELAGQLDGGEIVVSNPFENDWLGLIRLPGPRRGYKAPALTDLATGDRIPGQCVTSSNTAGPGGDFYVLPVQPGGIRRFKRARRSAGSPPSAGMENDHFRIDFDPVTAAVTSVLDKSTGRQLCDAGAPWSFAEIVHELVDRGGREAMYDSVYGSTDPRAKQPRPDFIRRAGHLSKRKNKLIAGPVFNSLLVAGRLPAVRFVREIRLYHAMHRIDVLLRLEKQIATDYESLYLAFPFAADDPEVWIEHAGAAYRAGVDQLPGSAADWHSLEQYVAVSDGQATVVLAPHDVPLVQVGDINTGKWAKRLEVRCGYVYSWIMNNMWYTAFPAYQEGVMSFTWSLTCHGGPFDRSAAEQFAHSARVGVVVSAPGAARPGA